MALVSKALPSLYGGVSQQPPTLRLDNQCEVMENCWPSIVHGLEKRPPTEYVAKLTTAMTDNVKAHLINRDVDEQYIVIFTGLSATPLEIYTLDGTKCTVRYGTLDADGGSYTPVTAVKDYLAGADPAANIRATTIADYTIISNKAITPAMSGSPTTADTPWAAFHCKTAYRNNVNFNVYIDGIKQGTVTTGSADWTTENVAYYLEAALHAALGAGWYHTQEGNVIYLYQVNTNDFDFYVTDSYGDAASVGIKGSVRKFEDLPIQAHSAMVGKDIKVQGNPQDNGESYYVAWTIDDEDGNPTAGYWKEVVKKGLDNTFNDATMPHRLVRTDTNEFTLAPILWEEREVGDDVSAPEPSFIGVPISDVILYKNRLGFLAGENVVLSRATDYFNFWPSTATEVLDDDPIDVAVSSNEVSVLRYGLPFNEQLLLFADQLQFVLTSGNDLLTPKSAACDISTHFEINNEAKPVAVGPNVYFMEPRGSSSAMREYFVQPDSYVNDAADVSAHVPTYVPDGIETLVAAPAFNTIFAAEPLATDLYVYRFHWNADEKVMSAWGKWIFEDPIYAAAALQNYLYLVVKPYANTFLLVKVNMEHVLSGSLDFRVHLDNQKLLTGVYADPYTTWTIPYNDDSEDVVAVDSVTGAQIEGTTRNTSLTVRALGDYSANPCYVGKLYTQTFRFSRWGIKAPNEHVDQLQGRLQIRTLTLNHIDTGYYKVQVTAGARSARNFMMTGVIEGESIYDEPTIRSGNQRFLIQGNAMDTLVDIINDTYLPSQFSTASWEGTYVIRNQAL